MHLSKSIIRLVPQLQEKRAQRHLYPNSDTIVTENNERYAGDDGLPQLQTIKE